jgi:hypothetical protein
MVTKDRILAPDIAKVAEIIASETVAAALK